MAASFLARRTAEHRACPLRVASIGIEVAGQKGREARAERWLKLALEGDVVEAPQSGYDPVVTNLGEERLQIVARQPLYDGGARRAGVARAEAQKGAAQAR